MQLDERSPRRRGRNWHVLVSREGVARLLGVRLLALGLSRSGEVVALTLEIITGVLGGGLLRVGLDSRCGKRVNQSHV